MLNLLKLRGQSDHHHRSAFCPVISGVPFNCYYYDKNKGYLWPGIKYDSNRIIGMKKKTEKQFLDNMSNNDAYWKGPFYFNRKDPRIMIPKRQSSLGWTLNFASPYAYIFLVALVAIIVAYILFFK